MAQCDSMFHAYCSPCVENTKRQISAVISKYFADERGTLPASITLDDARLKQLIEDHVIGVK